MVWDGITMTGKTDLHVCQGRVTGVYWLLTLFRLLNVTVQDSFSRMIMLGHIGQELLQTTFSNGIFVLYRGLR